MQLAGFAGAGIAILAGCLSEGSVPGGSDHVERAIQPIIAGGDSGAEQDAVVLVAQFAGDAGRRGLCSGTLVAKNLVLTARHCVSDTDPIADCNADGQPLKGAGLRGDRPANELFIFAGRGGVGSASSESAASARAKAILFDDATTICNHDIAFIVTDRPIDGPVAPIRIGGARADEALTAVGWGLTETGSLPVVRQQRTTVEFLGAGPIPLPDEPTSGSVADSAKRAGAGAAEFVVGESACAGDSGSPILSNSGAVIGVASRAGNGKARDPNNMAATCVGDSAHAIYAHLGLSPMLVVRAFKAANATAWIEGQPAPGSRTDTKKNDAGTVIETKMADASVSAAAEAPEAPEAAAASAPTGCNLSGATEGGAVEHAAGIVAALAMLLRLGRRARRTVG